MIVPNELRKCVAFIGYKMADDTFRMAGSAFFLGKEIGDGKADPCYAITARHVIDGIRNLGADQVWLRLNLKDGNAQWFQTELSNWYYDSDNYSDVAISAIGLGEIFDHYVYGYSRCITDDAMQTQEVALGDEVFITGLFRHHHGNNRNIPIVRVGNIASLNEEKVVTKYGEIDAYLIEARSIGGLSGSPVFLNLGISRYVGGSIKNSNGGPIIFLFGLIHGHYDVNDTTVDNAEEDNGELLSVAKVNTGIAIVVPMHTIFSVIQKFECQ